MKKFSYFFAVILSTVLILVGCQGNTSTKNNRTTDNTSFENTRFNDGTGTMRDTGRDSDFTQRVRNRNDDTGNLNRSTNNTQDRYEVSKEAADRIVEDIVEIDRAYVL